MTATQQEALLALDDFVTRLATMGFKLAPAPNNHVEIVDVASDRQAIRYPAPAIGGKRDEVRSNLKQVEAADWAVGIAYNPDEIADRRGTLYECTTPHVASSSDEPGTGVSWAANWTAV